MMQFCPSENTKAMLMLTHYFNRSDRRSCKPLTDNGFGYLAHWMKINGFQPQDLFDNEKLASFFIQFADETTHFSSKSALSGFMRSLDKTVLEMTEARFRVLLSRGMALSQALEKWQSAGIWIVSRADKSYPQKIKQKLREKAPAILFGTGNIELLNRKGIGFVGSRNCNTADEIATVGYVDEVVQIGYQVISGAAKGIDSIAMHHSLSQGYNAIGILGDGLYNACGDNQWRNYLKNNQLLLLSPFDPEATFGRGQNAMQRNKYIYFLSDAVIAVCAGVDGGTISGVKENLVNNWCLQLVSKHNSPNLAGNDEILAGFSNIGSKVKLLAKAKSLTPEQSVAPLMGLDKKLEKTELISNDTITDKTLTFTGSGAELLESIYLAILNLFKLKQNTSEVLVTLTKNEILEGLNLFVSVIGESGANNLLLYFEQQGLLIRHGDSFSYQIKNIEGLLPSLGSRQPLKTESSRHNHQD